MLEIVLHILPVFSYLTEQLINEVMVILRSGPELSCSESRVHALTHCAVLPQ